MDEKKLNGIRDGRARAAILEMVRMRHRAQSSRMDHVELWHMLRGVGFDLGENDVITFLQDLESDNAIKFVANKDRETNRLTITQIEMCPRGLRLVSGLIKDDSVLF